MLLLCLFVDPNLVVCLPFVLRVRPVAKVSIGYRCKTRLRKRQGEKVEPTRRVAVASTSEIVFDPGDRIDRQQSSDEFRNLFATSLFLVLTMLQC